MAQLPERQRVVVWLLHSSDWSMNEVAEFLEISKSSVQRHAESGMPGPTPFGRSPVEGCRL